MLVLLFGTVFSVQAQQDKDTVVASRYRPGLFWFFTGWKPAHSIPVPRYDRLVFDLLYNDWIMDDEVRLFSSPASSIGFNIHLMQDIPFTKKRIMSLGIGLGYGHSKIKSDKGMVMNLGDHSMYDVFPGDGYTKALFKSNRIFIPIELRFRTPGWQHFKFHIGGRIGYQFGVKTKAFNENGVEFVKKYPDLNPLYAAIHTRIGIRNWAITASYSLVPYFKQKESTKINGVEIGLSVSLF